MANNGLDVMFQEQMGMVVLNPTNEDFDMQYAGISFTIKSGEKRTLSSAAANHILNAFTQRGLCYLQGLVRWVCCRRELLIYRA